LTWLLIDYKLACSNSKAMCIRGFSGFVFLLFVVGQGIYRTDLVTYHACNA